MFDVEEVLAAMSLEEKIRYVSGKGQWRTKAMPQHRLPSVAMSDGPHGLRKETDERSEGGLETIEERPTMEAVCFPAGCAAAASWDQEVTAAIGRALGREAAASDVQVVLGPAVNIKRSPLSGRNFEYYSEDPYLAGKLAASYIKAIQAEGVAASIKHFAVNSQEYRRLSSSSNLSERALREIYLPNFEIAVKQAAPWTVMCSYNRINGVFASENEELLSEILRYEWGFDGAVISDWGAVNDRAKGLAAGLDLEMPSSGGANDENIRRALADGSLSESELDEACRRILTLVKRVEGQRSEEMVLDYAADHELACDLAARCMVLLKNDDLIPEGGDESIYLDANPEPLLPLSDESRIAFIGEMARKPRFQGGGSSYVHTKNVENAFEAAQKRGLDISYAQGYRLSDDSTDEELLAEAEKAALDADVAVIFAGLTPAYESEGYDRSHMDLPEAHNELIRRVLSVQPRTVVVLHNGSPVSMPWIDEVPAVLEAYIAGEGCGEAVVRILTGEYNPSGHLPESFPKMLEQTPCYGNYPGYLDEVNYMEDIYVGYRAYSTHKTDLLFPFGHGLSYTDFSFSGLKLSESELKADAQLKTEVSVEVCNTGERAGEALLQLYVSPRETEAAVGRPLRELKAFCKLFLEPGESRTAKLKLDMRSFAYYDEEKGEWHAAPGSYAVELCRNAEEVILSETVVLKNPFELRPEIGKNSCFEDLRAMPERWEVFLEKISAFSCESKEAVDQLFGISRAGLPLRHLRGYKKRFSEKDLEELIAELNRH